ncbi:putative RNA-directed DNA polymerase from transposon BS [Amphibalanus amphitrite]|uniref:Putative RNA-directed DNA polymerase from transposon BS n=1 Tax=Amphibalanus amphitrite TaxID=1232801 RepID=A0A6A4VLD2_AMPAM|nr:putative RNA-directed DNA polymerase from transposon BS [Amphibalanus amphitrite]
MEIGSVAIGDARDICVATKWRLWRHLAINGDRGQLVAEDRAKAEAFVRTYANVSSHTRHRRRDRSVKADLRVVKTRPCSCAGQRDGACQPFSRQEMRTQLSKLKMKKAPGADDVCAEHLKHLGPVAQAALLHVINKSWSSAEVPSVWRRAIIIPIPKVGKDPQEVTSYRPISLTSHVAKLMERMVAARLTHLLERDNIIPAEQVGFRRGRSAEENLGRLIQEVQDGWNRPPPKGRPSDGKTAARFVLTAYDFSRAYDVIDHQMLRLKMSHHLPRCLVTWIHHFLRDRRACAEVNGSRSRNRPFRAGLPQGSVLAPTLFTLWSADLVAALKRIPGTSVFLYADDTATLCSGGTIAEARDRAQQAADAIAKWARDWKMRLAGSKTQVLALSQHYVDARDLYIHVDGARVDAGRHLHLLGVTLDRQLHMGEHCARVRKKTKPRIAQLRKMTGRSWGLREPQLRVVANGYIRGALEYAAAAWLPAASESHVELLEIEMRAAARVITGCPVSTPRDPLLAEAGLVPVRARRDLLAARLSCLAASQRSGDPLRAVAEATAPRRLRTTTGWRDTGARALVSAGVRDVPVEERLHVTIPPWIDDTRVQFRLDIGNHISRTAPPDVRRERAEEHLATLPDDAVWVWSDGSAEGGVSAGGSGALIILPSGEEHELRAPAGRICSSTRAELVAIRGALEMLLRLEGGLAESPVIVCADSQAALATLASGAGSQATALGAAVWRLLLALTDGGRRVFMQWIPAHCGIPGNERADVLAKEASSLSQDAVPTDVRSMVKAVGRSATKAWRRSWPDRPPPNFFKTIMGDRMPMPVLLESRDEAVNVHQLRAGHWSRSQSYLHRIGRRPERDCPQCSDLACPAARCLVCREGPDTPEHVLLRADRPGDAGYGGVAILVKDSYPASVIPQPASDCAACRLESLWLREAGDRPTVLHRRSVPSPAPYVQVLRVLALGACKRLCRRQLTVRAERHGWRRRDSKKVISASS